MFAVGEGVEEFDLVGVLEFDGAAADVQGMMPCKPLLTASRFNGAVQRSGRRGRSAPQREWPPACFNGAVQRSGRRAAKAEREAAEKAASTEPSNGVDGE